MAQREDETDPNQDWWTQNAPPPTSTGPSWLPPGATLNADGSISLPNGSKLPAPPPGYTRDPNTGVVSYTGGAPMVPGLDPKDPNSANAPWEADRPAPTTPDPTTTTPGAPKPITPIGVPTSGFGSAAPDYYSDPNAPQYTPLPTYTPPQWTGGDFVNPTEAELLASPGYQARLDSLIKGRERASAAQGTILSGGTLKALDRAGQDYASNEYQQFRGNALENYKQRYSQFQDAAGMDFNARTMNANQNQANWQNQTSRYNTGNARTLSDYLTNVTKTRNAELDYWGRLKDVNDTGSGLAGNSYRP